MRLLQIICPDCRHTCNWDANAHDVIAATLLCKCGANINVHFKSKRFLDSLTEEPGKLSAIDARTSE